MGRKDPTQLPPATKPRLRGSGRGGWLDEMLDTHPISDAARKQQEHDRKAVAEYRKRMEEGTLEYGTIVDGRRW